MIVEFCLRLILNFVVSRLWSALAVGQYGVNRGQRSRDCGGYNIHIVQDYYV